MIDPWRSRFRNLVAGALIFRLLYIASGLLDLAPDETYYWVWSRHFDLSYFSKGPLVAYLIAASTAIGGDSDYFVRLSAVLLGGLTLIYLGRLTRAVFGGWRAAFWAAAIFLCIPVFAATSTLMTIDSPLLCAWAAASFYAWRACGSAPRRADWLLTGLAIGLGLMAKAVMIFFIPSLLLFLILNRDARRNLRAPGPWIALTLGLAFTIPQLVWNARHDWPMFRDFAKKADVGEAFAFSLANTLSLLGSQAAVLSPLIFLGLVAAIVQSVRRARRGDASSLFVACLSLPVIGFYLALSMHTKVNSNWFIAGYLGPLAALSVYALERWDAIPSAERRTGFTRIRFVSLGAAALLLGGLPVLALHFTAPLYRLTDSPKLAEWDPTSRLAGWRAMAERADRWREELDLGSADGKPVFQFGINYQVPSVLRFYGKGHPPAYSLPTNPAANQYYFLDDLNTLKGRDALYVATREHDGYLEKLRHAFDSVEELEVYPVMRGRVKLRDVYFYRCRGFKGWSY